MKEYFIGKYTSFDKLIFCSTHPLNIKLAKLQLSHNLQICIRSVIKSTKRQRNTLTWATPCTCAVVPSGSWMTGLLGSTWMIETVPSGLLMVCTTGPEYTGFTGPPTCTKTNILRTNHYAFEKIGKCQYYIIHLSSH